MKNNKPFKLGVVEGFFGKSWDWQTRASYADFLHQYHFNAYLYAPKNDEFLRKKWSSPFPPAHLDKLQTLCKTYRNKGIEFGIGLSPFELYRDFNTTQKILLKKKLNEINEIEPNTLCILFDDMKGDFSQLAHQQSDIMDFVSANSQVDNLIMCPTYYSNDPILARHFGDMPINYLEDLGTQLTADIDIFWTGPLVFSTDFPAQHLLELEKKLRRKPLLWDNYPVNDSKKLADFLHLRPFSNRSPKIKNLASGHMVNPMNQGFLSQLALHSLHQIYQSSSANSIELFQLACHTLCDAELSNLLIKDAPLFQDHGLDAIDEQHKLRLLSRYKKHQSNPMAKEILDWLEGQYSFDPECLT